MDTPHITARATSTTPHPIPQRGLSLQTPPAAGGIGGHLLVATEHRFIQTPDGTYWSTGSGHYATWRRLLPPPSGCSPFAAVTIAARVAQVSEAPPHAKAVEGPGLTVAPLPIYIGPLGYLRSRRQLLKTFAALVSSDTFTCFMARQPGVVSGRLVRVLRTAGRSWITEVVGDPSEVFCKSGGLTHPLRRFFGWKLSSLQRRVAAESLGVVYVSGGALQSRYPTSGIVGIASNVDLQPECYRAPQPAKSGVTKNEEEIEKSEKGEKEGVFQLALIGSLDQPYKGVDTALEALALVRARGVDARLRVIGEGRLMAQYQAQAASLGITGAVEWTGAVAAGAGVRAQLNNVDLYIQPSRTEGMPRALLEACAWGCPALGTPVGGIPEILPTSALVPSGDPSAWADRIHELWLDSFERSTLASALWARAHDWSAAILTKERHRVYLTALRHVMTPYYNRISMSEPDDTGADSVASVTER